MEGGFIAPSHVHVGSGVQIQHLLKEHVLMEDSSPESGLRRRNAPAFSATSPPSPPPLGSAELKLCHLVARLIRFPTSYSLPGLSPLLGF